MVAPSPSGAILFQQDYPLGVTSISINTAALGLKSGATYSVSLYAKLPGALFSAKVITFVAP